MIAHFYNNKSDNNVVNKTLTEVSITHNDITFKNPTDLEKPVILMKFNSDLMEKVKNINYIYIEDLAIDRKYFVTNRNFINNDIVEFTCKTDVLSTFFDDIKDKKAIIGRNSNQYKPYIPDNKRIFSTRHKRGYKNFTVEGLPPLSKSYTDKIYMITVGDGHDIYGV